MKPQVPRAKIVPRDDLVSDIRVFLEVGCHAHCGMSGPVSTLSALEWSEVDIVEKHLEGKHYGYLDLESPTNA